MNSQTHFSVHSEADLERLFATINRIQESISSKSHVPIKQNTVPIATETSEALAMAKRIYAARRARSKAFGVNGSIFQEPAWDILLDLYIAQAQGGTISVSSACIASNVPPTTALRWLSLLEKCGLITRTNDPFDGRRSYVALSTVALGAMAQFLTRV